MLFFLARIVAKWTEACDRRLARLISYIYHTSNNRQYCQSGNTTQHCRLGLFQDSDLLATLRTQNQLWEESYVYSEVEHLSPSVGCARNKRQYLTALQNKKLFFRWMLVWGWSGYLFLTQGTWWWLCHVHRRVPNHQPTGHQETVREITNPKLNQRETEMLINCHMWTTSPQTHTLLKASQLYVYEDNEAVIKIIIRGRSPTMRHVSKTHRVALDWSTDRINLDTENPNQICRHQKNKSRTCWPKVLLHVVNGTIFFDCWTSWISRCFPAGIFLSNRQQSVMFKRAQESTPTEGSAVAKPRPMNLVSRNFLSAKEPPPQDSSASNSRANQKLDQSFVSSSARKLLRKQQPRLNSTFWRAETIQAPGNWWGVVNLQVQGAPGNWCEVMTVNSKGQCGNSTICKSDHRYLEKVFKNPATKVESRRRSTNTRLEDHLYWSEDYLCRQRWKPLFILDLITLTNWKNTRNTNFEELKEVFDITQRLILEHEPEILNVTTIDWTFLSCTRSALSHDQVIKWTKAKKSTRLLRFRPVLGKDARAVRSEPKMECSTRRISTVQFLQKKHLELMENRLSSSGIFSQDLRHWRSSRRSKKTCKIETLKLIKFEGQIIFMSMFNDIAWTKRRHS